VQQQGSEFILSETKEIPLGAPFLNKIKGLDNKC
jgi:hypothetical protein